MLTLGFEERRRSRMRIRLDDGREAALLLPRGTVLRDGDRLRDPERDETVTVRAAAQTLSFVRAADPVAARARRLSPRATGTCRCRSAPGWLAYEHDHVLDDMVADLGLAVETRVAPFEPEAGGYRHGEHGGHRHEHGHEHGHEHDH